MAQDKVCLGAIAGAVGVRGEVKIKPFTDDPGAVASYGAVETEDGRVFEITPVRAVKGGIAARIKGVSDRTAAEALKGTRLYVDRAALPEPDDADDFYHADLLGLDAVLADGTLVATVKAVQDYGAGDLLELRLAASGKTVLIPFTRECVPEVDLAGGRVVIDPFEGMLDPGGPKGQQEDGA